MPIRPWDTLSPPPSLAAPRARPLSLATTALLLTAVTLLGAALRFVRLDVPTLWGDELATHGRVIGTFDQLMERLVNEGFVPLHYVLYWLLAQATTLSPFMMRVIPALCGTLLIPAVYFLARQMTTRRVALLAALLAATSAFGLIYSRDAKMYVQTWLFVTLATACLLHHLRSKGWWAWGGWVLGGAVAASLHATALMMLAIWPLMLLTHEGKRRRRDSFLFGLGCALIVAFPAWYYLGYNRYIARTAIAPAATAADGEIDPQSIEWKNSGLEWIVKFNRGVSGWHLTLNSATNYVLGAQWPRRATDPGGYDPDTLPPWFPPAVSAGMSVTVGLLVLGALPWRRGRAAPLSPRERVASSATPFEGAAGLGASPWRRASTAAWPGAVRADPPHPGPLPGGEGAGTRHPLIGPAREGEGEEAAVTDRAPQPWWVMLTWLAAWLIVPTYGVYYCRSFADFAPPWALLQWAWGYMGWHWLTAVLLAVSVVGVLHARPGLGATAARGVVGAVVFTAVVAGALAGAYWLPTFADVMREPVVRWPVVVLGLALGWWHAAATTRGRLRQAGHLLSAAGVVFVACVVAWAVWKVLWRLHEQSHPNQPWQSIWMPRYLGVVYPAVLVAMAVLLARLPTVPLRVGAVALVVALNLVQPMARLLVTTEAPAARVAADAWSAQREPVHTRLIVNLEDNGGHQGNWLREGRTQYYLFDAAGVKPTRDTFDWKLLGVKLDLRVSPTPAKLSADVNATDRGPRPARLIVWERFGWKKLPPEGDAVAEALGAGWRRTEDEVLATRQFWTWRRGDVYRRRLYERVE